MQKTGKNLIDQIRDSYPTLSKGHQKLADYIINNPKEGAFLSINALSRETGISAATITRFVRVMGCSGYQEFQREVYDARLQQTPFSKLKSELQRVDSSDGDGEDPILLALRSDAQMIESLYTQQNRVALDRSTTLLRKARRIYILGNGSSYAVAYLLGFMLRRMYGNVQLLEASTGALSSTLCDVSAEDCLIAVAYSRYTKLTCDTVSYCRKKGCAVIALTDSMTSQVALESTEMLIAPRDEYFSPVCAMAMCSCLIAALGQYDAPQMLARMEQQDQLSLEFGVYL